MSKKTLAYSFIIFIFTFFSIIADAAIRLNPSNLVCPNTREGEESDCGTLSLQNSNILLSIKVGTVEIGDTENFTIDASQCAGKSLKAKESCAISVTFHPQAGGGFYTKTNVSYSYLKILKNARYLQAFMVFQRIQ